jgi:hypothetical protein
MIGVGTLEKLRSDLKYQYSVMTASEAMFPTVRDGIVTRARSGQTQILTNESEAYGISRFLLEKGIKFSMSKISLEDVFFHLVYRTDSEAQSA